MVHVMPLVLLSSSTALLHGPLPVMRLSYEPSRRVLPPRGTAKAQPGTTALSSPEGFEEVYASMRAWRQKHAGRPLVDIKQLDRHAPDEAQQLRERVNFDVPRTATGAVTTFISHPTAQFICGALVAAIVARWRLKRVLSVWDIGAGAVTALFWTVQEWAIHNKLLHSRQAWLGERVHRWHHELPYYHVSLDGLGLASVWFATVGIVLVGLGLLTCTLAPCLTALAVYTLCGGLYEAAHFLAHTRTPLPRYLENVRRHHALHHNLSDQHWLAFTVPAIDTLFGTAPDPKAVKGQLPSPQRQRQQSPKVARSGGVAMSTSEATVSHSSQAPLPPPSSPASSSESSAIKASLKGQVAGSLKGQVAGLVRMARVNSIPMGAGLVGIGAYGARGFATSRSYVASRLVLGMLLTVIVTSGSMLINDYHDYRLGVDNELTKPGRPLVTGEVQPDTVKLVLKWGYALHLTLLCFVDTTFMRLWVLCNTLLTYLYSVHLKPITGVKNAVCATIVASAIGLGALSTGGGGQAIAAVRRPMLAVGGLIWHREMIMDIKDLEGDAMAGVQTVPVALGVKRAMLLALAPLAVAAGATATASRGALVATTALLLQSVASLTAWSHDFEGGSLKAAIELAPLWLTMALVALCR